MLISYDGALEETIYGMLKGSALGVSLGSTNDEVLGSDEGIKCGSTNGEVLGSVLGGADGITLGPDEGTDLYSLCD